MDAVTFVSDALRQVQLRLLETCQGLTQDQVLWRPSPHANNIGFILWHLTRGEDDVISDLGTPGPGLWVSQRWHEKFNQPVEAPDPGDRMALQSLSIPDLEVLLGYSKAVHQRSLYFLSSLAWEMLDRSNDPTRSEPTVAAALRHLITHKNNHHGQIDYIRGLQDQNWDLPPERALFCPTPNEAHTWWCRFAAGHVKVVRQACFDQRRRAHYKRATNGRTREGGSTSLL